MAMDVKKEQKTLYQANATPAIVDVPELNFITVDGSGDPGTSEEYKAALEALYTIAYGVKMLKKGEWLPPDYVDFVVPPLEGLWTTIHGEPYVSGQSDKNELAFTSLVQLPDFVTPDVFDRVRAAASAKKPQVDLTKVKLQRLTEGLCAQILHIGPYDDEPATIAVLEKFIVDAGRHIDIGPTRHHHEIYLNDPRRVAPQKMKTILRLPIA